MQNLQDWFDTYAQSHQNKTNKLIHYICVPIIYFSIIGLLMSIPSNYFTPFFKFSILANWAFIALLFVFFFYIKLSVSMSLKMIVFSFLCLYLNTMIKKYFCLWQFSILLFVLAWIGQFYGHKIEGKKPSFINDLKFLLIGPAWVINAVFSKK